MNKVVNKRIICSDSDILDPNCSKNALLSVSIRSHVVVSQNFSFSSVRGGPFYGVVAVRHQVWSDGELIVGQDIQYHFTDGIDLIDIGCL